jgi:PhoH-like ATPase
MVKNFVLDTNVILYDPQAIYKFQDNCLIIPMTVIEEVDRFKKDMNEIGRNARQFSRILDDLRKKGSLASGITMEHGGCLRVEMYEEEYMKSLPRELREEQGDNRILAIAIKLKATE